MLAEVLGCSPPLIELKLLGGSPNTIYFHIKKSFRGAHQSLKFQKMWGNNSKVAWLRVEVIQKYTRKVQKEAATGQGT